MHQVLVTTPEALARVEEILTYAEAHPFSFEDVQKIAEGARKPAGADPNLIMVFPIDIGVAFSYETTFIKRPVVDLATGNVTQEEGAFKVRHISLSRPNGKLPNPFIAEEIMKLFGFKHSVTDLFKGIPAHRDLYAYEEVMEVGKAINIIEIITENDN